MARKKKEVNLNDRIDSIIDLLEDLRYQQSKKNCANCKGKNNDPYSNINDEDEENE